MQLVGTGGNEWGTPIFSADSASPEYLVTSERYPLPVEFESPRIPANAEAADNADAAMIVYDLEHGYVPPRSG